MKINSISENQSFKGKLILKNKISTHQNYLFNLHKEAIEKKIKDLPFDLFVEQSKSKKTISMSTNVEGANKYIVRKNQHDFEETVDLAIADAKQKSEIYKKIVKVNEIFDYKKIVLLNVIFGNFKKARNIEKTIAEIAVDDFETYKSMPKISVINVPFSVLKVIFMNSIKYKIYRAFTSKTPEEKELAQMCKNYFKQLKAENRQIETVELDYKKYAY